MTYVARVGVRTAIWVLLWGDVSVANVASGIVVSSLLLVLYPVGRATLTGGLGRPRPFAALLLVGHIARQLVVSNAIVAAAILTPGPRLRSGVVVCPLHTRSERMITFLANVLSLSPGTMPVEVRTEPPTISLHVLFLHDPVATRRKVVELERLAVRAFGSLADVSRLSEHPVGAPNDGVAHGTDDREETT